MTTVRSLLLPLVTATLMLTPRLSTAQDGGVEDYCCVCNSCSASAELQCFSVMAKGTREADCKGLCTNEGCRFLEVLDGVCEEHAADCHPSPAPAASRSVLFALGVVLTGAGIYLARRRVTR